MANADLAFKRLWNELTWERRETTPRREYYANEFLRNYTYGKAEFAREYEPRPWHPLMCEMQEALEALTDSRLEVCFLNGYENSRDQLGWHADDSPEMCDTRPIGIISLGAEREIMFAPKETKSPVTKLKMGDGSLCLMHAGMPDTHVHRSLKTGFECGLRISRTFRGFVA